MLCLKQSDTVSMLRFELVQRFLAAAVMSSGLIINYKAINTTTIANTPIS